MNAAKIFNILEETGILNVSRYHQVNKEFTLEDTISEQEVMKIVAKLSGDEIEYKCDSICNDVDRMKS